MESGTHPLWPLLVSYRDSYKRSLDLLGTHFGDYSKKDQFASWIDAAYYYADLTYQTGIRILQTGGKLSQINKEGTTLKPILTPNDLIDLYTVRVRPIQSLEHRARALYGDAVPIVPGTLRFHEKLGTGLLEDRHVLARHVPRFVEDLHRRLEREPDSDIVSGFLTREIAESALARTIVRNEDEIQVWLRSGLKKQEFTADFGTEAVGLVLRRNQGAAFSGHKVTIVLVRDVNSPAGYWIKTSKIDN